MKDLYHNVLATQILDPQTSTATKTSSALDLQGYNSATVLFAIGTSGDTLSVSLYWTLSLQESDDNSNYTDVAASDLHNGAATIVVNSMSLDQAIYAFGYKGGKRYLKGIATPTGSVSSGVPIGIVGLRGDAGYSPVQ